MWRDWRDLPSRRSGRLRFSAETIEMLTGDGNAAPPFNALRYGIDKIPQRISCPVHNSLPQSCRAKKPCG
jgi:hypothetical protein